MKKFLSSCRHCRGTSGAILIEVLMALVIFTVGMTAAFALLTQSSLLNSISRNRVVAINLAREALEVVKNIRDTNWLIYSANLRECWHFSPDTNENGDMTDNDACTPNASGQNGHPIGLSGTSKVLTYIVDFDAATARWMLLPAAKYLNTTVTPQVFSPYGSGNPNGELESINPENYSTAGGEKRDVELGLDAEGRYTHHTAAWTGAASVFVRTVDIEYLDSDDGYYPNGDAQNDKADDNRMKLTAQVFWKERPGDTAYKSIEIETIITDYLNRTNWLL